MIGIFISATVGGAIPTAQLTAMDNLSMQMARTNIATALNASENFTVQKNTPNNITAFGDSITAIGNYPEYLNATIHKYEPSNHYIMIKSGTSGSTTTDALNRIGTITNISMAYTFILYGANDMPKMENIPYTTTEKNLNAIVYFLIQNGSIPIIGNITPTTGGGYYSLPISEVYLRNTIIENVSKKYGIPKAETFYALMEIDGKSVNTSLFSSDGLHPIDSGYKKIAGAMYDAYTGQTGFYINNYTTKFINGRYYYGASYPISDKVTTFDCYGCEVLLNSNNNWTTANKTFRIRTAHAASINMTMLSNTAYSLNVGGVNTSTVISNSNGIVKFNLNTANIFRSVYVSQTQVSTLTGTITRSFSSSIAVPGATRTVTLTPAPLATFDTPGYQVIETIPAGFTVTANTAATATNVGNIWTFTNIGSASLTYTITVPLTTGNYTFSGTFKDENQNSGTVSGLTIIRVGAGYDINGNGKIDKNEAIQAVIDYFNGNLSKQDAIDVVLSYFS